MGNVPSTSTVTTTVIQVEPEEHLQIETEYSTEGQGHINLGSIIQGEENDDGIVITVAAEVNNTQQPQLQEQRDSDVHAITQQQPPAYPVSVPSGGGGERRLHSPKTMVHNFATGSADNGDQLPSYEQALQILGGQLSIAV